MQFKFITSNDPEYLKELMLRWEILRKPLGLPPGSEVAREDADSLHLVAMDKKELVGCVIFHPETKEMGRQYQMAVSEEYRGKGFGRKLIFTLEQFLLEKGYREVYVYAREESIGFYKQMGYHGEGEPLEMVGLPHFMMKKHLVMRAMNDEDTTIQNDVKEIKIISSRAEQRGFKIPEKEKRTKIG